MRTIGITKLIVLSISLSVLIGCSRSSAPDPDSQSPDTPENQQPAAIISPAAVQFIIVGDTINFAGNSSTDPDSNTPLSYAWTFTGAATSMLTYGAANPGPVSFTETGMVTVSLVVTDSLGLASDITSIIVNVGAIGANRPPNGFINHDNGDGTAGSTGDISIRAGISVEFNGSATDPENDPVTYSWIFEGGTASSTTGSGPIIVNYTTTGTYIVRLTVTDSNGNSDPTPAELTVNVGLPEFKYLPVLSDEDGNLADNKATFNLTTYENVFVNVVTPNGSWVTPMMRYNALQLPPVIVAKRGTDITVNVQNNLNEVTTVHWHGFQVPAIQDGGPDFPILAGDSRTYNFTLIQPAGPLWFHPHAMGTTATQVYYGLAGAFIVTDDITENLDINRQIPSGDQDIALLLQDRRFAADNGFGIRTLIYAPGGGMMGGVVGMLGDHILVNGVELPGLEVGTRQYRFRIYNGSNARTYDVALADNTLFKVVGTDGGLLNSPVETNHIMLASGERAEIVVDFGNYAVGDNVLLVSRAFPTGGVMGGGGGALPNGAAFDIMRFEITTQVTDDVTLYASLPASADINSRLTAADASVIRPFVMSIGPGMQLLINGLSFDINRVDELVSAGATEIWDISNTSPMAHPFHAHAMQWQILDRNGIPASGVDLGWKDTVLVQSNESVRFIGRFDPVVNKGKYMYHCHILEHEEAGMMGIFEVQ